MAKSVSNPANTPSPAQDVAPSVDLKEETVVSSSKIDGVTAYALRYAHEAGYTEGYDDAIRVALIVMSISMLIALLLLRIYDESK